MVDVHPNIAALLAQLAESDQPPLWEMGPAGGRELYRAMSTLTDPTDVPIGSTEDTSFRGPAGEVPVRIYTPVAAAGTGLNCLVFFHGGGFVIGDLDSHDALCRQLANESGCKVVAVDYRLAPENPFPAAVDDCYAAVKWVEAHASDLGINANCLAVAGDSAGGNLSAVVSQMARDKKGPKICFQLLMYPTTKAKADTQSMKDFEKGYFLEREVMDWFMDSYIPNDADLSDPRLSPLLADDLSGLPAALVVTAGYDPLKDEGKAYADRLEAAGVPVTYKDYPDMIHGFFNMTALAPEAKDAVLDAARAVKAAFAK